MGLESDSGGPLTTNNTPRSFISLNELTLPVNSNKQTSGTEKNTEKNTKKPLAILTVIGYNTM